MYTTWYYNKLSVELANKVDQAARDIASGKVSAREAIARLLLAGEPRRSP